MEYLDLRENHVANDPYIRYRFLGIRIGFASDFREQNLEDVTMAFVAGMRLPIKNEISIFCNRGKERE